MCIRDRVRGGICVGIPQVWGDWFVLAKCLSLLCEVVFVLVVHCLYWEVVFGWERSCVLPVVFALNPQWRFPMWESCVDKVSGNPSLWRRGRRAVCSNLETYPCVSDWSTFSLFYYCALHHFILLISYLYAWLWLFVCASLVFNHESFI